MEVCNIKRILAQKLTGGAITIDVVPENVQKLIPKMFPVVGVVDNNFIRDTPIENLIWMEKVDGLRRSLVIYDKFMFEIVKNEFIFVRELDVNEEYKGGLTILDTELYNDIYRVFDICYLFNENISELDYISRVNKTKYFITSINSKIIDMIDYKLLTNWIEVLDYIENELSPVSKIPLDGVIIQKIDAPFLSSNPTFNFHTYKLKRHALNTIDFLFKYVKPLNKYFLYLSGNYYSLLFNTKKLPKENGYSVLHTGVELFKGAKYPNRFDILFSSSFKENSHEFTPRVDWNKKGYHKNEIKIISEFMNDMLANPEKYDSKIIECSYANDGWVPFRIRDDKMFANSYRIGLSTMNVLFSPVIATNIDNLIIEKDSEMLTNLKKIWSRSHTAMRESIYKKLCDLASNNYIKINSVISVNETNGFDVKNYVNNNISNIFSVDTNKDSLIVYNSKIIELRKNYISFNAICNTLTNDNSELIKDVKNRYEFPSNGFNLMIINNIHNIQDTKDLVKTIKELVQPGYYFMFTYFDGDEIKKNAKNNELTLKNFNINILDDCTIKMTSPLMKQPGWRNELLITTDFLEELTFKQLLTYTPFNDNINMIKHLDPEEDVSDYLKYFRVCIMQV